MQDLPRAAQFFWLGIVASGAFVAIKAFSGATTHPFDWVAVALFAAAGTVAYHFRIHLPHSRERQGEWTSVAMAVNIAAAMALPVPEAIAVVLVENCIYPFFGRPLAWYKRAFNVSQVVLSVAAAGSIWHSLGGGAGMFQSPWSAVAIALALAWYFSVNAGSVTLIVALAERAPVQHVWMRGHNRILPSYLAVMFTGVLGGYLWSTVPASVILLLIPLVAIYYSLRRTVELEEQTMSALFELADVMDKRDYYTHGHSLRVGEFAERLAMFLRLSADDARMLYLCGRLHDIGKCAVDNEVLLKPGPLNEEERAHIMRHTHVGAAMLAHFSLFKAGASYVRGHHERWDGAGYPDGLKGEEIPFGARLISVVDSYDAMTSTRPYRTALPHHEAVRRLREGAGIQWDPRLVEAFLEMLARQDAAKPARGALPTTIGDEGAVNAVRP